MKRILTVCIAAIMTQGVQAQVTEAPRTKSSYLGLGLTNMSGYYTGINAGTSGISFAPTVLGSLGISRAVAIRGSIAYGQHREDRDESNSVQRFVRHRTTNNVVVPILLQVGLNPSAPRFHVAAVGGFTFWNSTVKGTQTYYYNYPSQPEIIVPENLDAKRQDVFLTGGFNASYQVNRHLVALADMTISGRLGEKVAYYEFLPSAGLMIGVGYRLGKHTE